MYVIHVPQSQMWCVSAHDCVLRGIGNIIIRMTHLYVCANSTLNFFIYYVNGKVGELQSCQ